MCEFLCVLSGGIDSENCKRSHSLGLWFIRERASEVTSLLNVAFAQRGAPGDSDDLEALDLVIWFPCILVPSLLPYPSGVGVNM